jgi:hypothetical protein
MCYIIATIVTTLPLKDALESNTKNTVVIGIE